MKYLFSLLVILSLALGTSAFAQSQDSVQVDITKLTPAQLQVWQQLKQQQASAQSVAASLENLTPDKIDKYAAIGKAFGSAFKECWSTVSTDAERFAQSPAGKWAMVLVSWKIMGEDAVNLTRTVVQWIIGGTLLLVGIPFWIWLVRRNCVQRPIATIERTGFLGLNKKVVYRDQNPLHEEWTIAYGACFLIYLGATALITFLH